MTAKDVRKIKTTYRAVQWKEERQDANDILEILDGCDAYAYFEDDLSYAYVHVYTNKTGTESHTLMKGEWIVTSSKGKVEILSDWEYAEKYEDND